MVVGAAGPPCWMTSITMSANSSDVDVVVGPGWVDGSALAVDIVNPERPMSTPAATGHSHRMSNPLLSVHTSTGYPVNLAPAD